MSVPDDAVTSTPPSRGGAYTPKKPLKRNSTAIAEGEPPLPVFEDGRDDAILRLIRTSWGGMLVSFTVEIDGCFVSELAYGVTLDLRMTAGEHLVTISGGGAFFGVTERVYAQELELLAYTVSYSWYGGVKLSRVVE